MNNKVLVNLNVPMFDETYSVFIPISKTVANVTELLEKAIAEFSGVAYEKRIGTSLYDSTGKRIDPNLIVKDSGINNGSLIIII